MKMRVSPVGVYVRFARPGGDRGDGSRVTRPRRKTARCAIAPAGAADGKGFQKLDVDDSKFLADNRHPVTQWGMGPIIELIATATARRRR